MIGLIIPLLSLGLYLGFASFNSRYVSLPEISLWGIAALVFGGLVFLIVYKLSKNPNTRALIGCIVVASFFSYGYLAEALGDGKTIVLAIIYGSVLIGIACIIWKLKLSDIWRLPLLVAVVASVILPITSMTVSPSIAPVTGEARNVTLDRDIYIVILDRYARADMLEKYFDFDNRPFLEELEDRGFQIADKSMCNYNTTHSAIASMLNVQYLDILLPGMPEDEESRVPIYGLISDNWVKQSIGDQWLTVGSWWTGTRDAQFLLSEYAMGFLKSTLLQPIIHYWEKERLARYDYLVENKMVTTVTGTEMYARDWSAYLLWYQFGTLHQLAKSSYDYHFFLLAHILSPHPPYIFDADGNIPDSEASKDELYLGLLQYTNGLVLDWLDNVIKYSPDAVVVLMSDEGAKGFNYLIDDAQIIGDFTTSESTEMHSCILMAVRGVDIYPSITPINVMRLIANKYLGESLELLEDRSFNVTDSLGGVKYPYKYVEILDK